MKYHFKISQQEDKFSAECVELQGFRILGKSEGDLYNDLTEALTQYLNNPLNFKKVIPVPNYNLKGKKIVPIKVDPKLAWAVLLKNARLAKGMTQMEAATALHFKNIYAYQKLESSKTANPELATMVKIKKVFPELDLEEIFDR